MGAAYRPVPAGRSGGQSVTATSFRVVVHRVEDGLPDMDELVGRVAFIWDGHVVSGWPIYNEYLPSDEQRGSLWEPADDRFGGPVSGVTHWIEFPVPVWDLGKAGRKDGNLVKHARVELERIGEEPETIDGYLNVIRAFAAMGHSGGSASVAIPVIHRLLQFLPLGPLTDDPDEWQDVSGRMPDGTTMWQNRRDGRAFSQDGGQTYWLVDDDTRSVKRAKSHKDRR